jgi:hypothetical protein
MPLPYFLIGGLILFVVLLSLQRIATRSGVTNAEIAKPLPGDDLVPDPQLIMDRAATFTAPPDAVWPWIAQLGKGRAGWYFPRWLERLVNRPQFAGLRRIEPTFQHLQVGEDTPDWGPGDPVFRVAEIEPPYNLIYLSKRDPSANWTWPSSEFPVPDNTLLLSWALILEEGSHGSTRLLVRLRMARTTKPLGGIWAIGGGLIDYLTIVLLFAGLRERLKSR